MEMLDVVNENDEVVGKASSQNIYRHVLPHRIVHILIFNTNGEMALQLRSAKKSFCPLHWSTAVGGHVRSGESYEMAALREFEEELGRKTEIRFLRKDVYENGGGPKKFLTTFTAFFDGPFSVNPEEVERVEFFPLATVENKIKNGDPFHPELLFLLQKQYFKKKV